MPARLVKHRNFCVDLARFASLTESGQSVQTPVLCRRRPQRLQCRGLLWVRRRDIPALVEWRCPECDAAGQVSGWENGDADLRPLNIDPTLATHSVEVSVAGHAALRELARSEAALFPLTYLTEVNDEGQPQLRTCPAESLLCGSMLLPHILETSSPRVSNLLTEVLDGLASLAAPSYPQAMFAEMTPSDMDAFQELLFSLEDTIAPQFVPSRPSPAPRSTKNRSVAPKTLQIKVSLRDVKPPVWRRLIVPSDILLPMLHEVIQAAMGWNDYHLHLFRAANHSFAPHDHVDPIGEDSRGVSLGELASQKGDRVVYEYDFGDGWSHDLLVEDVIEDRCQSIRCLTGKRPCPPEDCGGPWGYEDLRLALTDSAHDRHEEALDLLGSNFDANAFDVVAVDASVRRFRIRPGPRR